MTMYIKEWSENPGLRYEEQCPHSAEEYYLAVLNPKFKECSEKKETLKIVLDGTNGFASSFLDELFGNLVYDFGLDLVKDYLDIISNDEPAWKEIIEEQSFKQWQERRSKNEVPKRTMSGEKWFRFLSGNYSLFKG